MGMDKYLEVLQSTDLCKSGTLTSTDIVEILNLARDFAPHSKCLPNEQSGSQRTATFCGEFLVQTTDIARSF